MIEMVNIACLLWWIVDFLPLDIQEEDYLQAYEIIDWDVDIHYVEL